MIGKRRWPWVAQQNWQDILFIHTPIEFDELQSLVPSPLEIETFNEKAWVSIILFKATNSRLRYMPSYLSFTPFYQMNIRTYVKFGDEPGVYFFSITTNSQLATLGGRLTSMPFRYADLNLQYDRDRFTFKASRDSLNFKVDFSPISSAYQPQPDTLPYFLTERYCIWMFSGTNIVKAPILHSHWNIHDVDLSIEKMEGLPFPFVENSIAHYTRFKHSMVYPFERFGKLFESRALF